MGDLTEGTILNGRYEIHEKIGEGGMSFVYRAEDMESGEIVAVKVLKKEFSYDEEFIRRFRNEAEAAKRLSHPNIVAIYDLENDDDIQYIVMEYIEGLTLDKLIKAKKKLPWRNTLKITAQILSAVEHAHNNKIIHRDIKPLNIMITDEGVVKLTDFGIARAVSSATKSASKDSVGSVHYLSPEQVRGGFVDERSDIYSIGITMYEMITGSVPYDGDSHVSIALKHIDGKIVPPRDVDSTVPYGVSDLIVLATRKEVNMRFQSAGEMYEQLLKVIKNPYSSFLSEYESEKEEHAPVEIEDANENDTELTSESADIIREENIEKEKNTMAIHVVLQTVTYLAAVIVSILVLIFIVSRNNIIKDKFDDYTVKQYKIGDYRGMLASSVFESMEGTNIKVEQELVESDAYPAGYVLDQSVKSGEFLYENDVIQLSVSAREGSIILDDYTGQSFQVIGTQLMTQEIKVVYKEMYSSKYDNGRIIRTSPGPGSIVEKNDEVVIYYSAGNLYKKVVVPNVIGMTLEQASQELAKANVNLNVGVIYPSPSAIVDDLIVTPAPSGSPSASPSPKPTKEPTPSPTPTPTVEITPEPETETETPEVSDGTYDPDWTPNPDDPTDSPEPGDGTGYETETPPETEMPTPTPTPTPTPKPTSTPTPTHTYASDKVVAQYPAPGTEVMINEKVNLYFYDVNKITPRKKLVFNFPEGSITGTACYVRIEAVMTDSNKPAEVVFMDPALKTEKFPLEYEVPVSLNGAPTKVSIYIGEQGGTPWLYKVIKIYG